MMKKILYFCLLLSALAICGTADAVVMDFEDQTLGTPYIVGNSFAASGVSISVSQFQPLVGPPLSGSAVVTNTGKAGGVGKELFITNVDLDFLFDFSGCPSCGVALLFGEYGEDNNLGINLGINGDLQKAEDFYGLPGVIGGANVYVATRGGNLGTMLIVSGVNINTLTIGGEEVAIDTVFACETVPEPATITLLGLGALSVFAGRKRRN